jgi:hypothetical protein
MNLRFLGAAALLAVAASVSLVGEVHGPPGCPDRTAATCVTPGVTAAGRPGSAAGRVDVPGSGDRPPAALPAAAFAVAAAAASGAAATVRTPCPAGRPRRPEPAGRHRRSARPTVPACGQLAVPGAVAVGSVGPRA